MVKTQHFYIYKFMDLKMGFSEECQVSENGINSLNNNPVKTYTTLSGHFQLNLLQVHLWKKSSIPPNTPRKLAVCTGSYLCFGSLI